MKLLIKHGCSLSSGVKSGADLCYRVTKNREEEMLEYLISIKAPFDEPNPRSGMTPLCLSASEGNTEIVKLLINGGANPNTLYRECLSPIYLAARRKKYEVVKLLASLSSVRAQMQTSTKNNPLFYAIKMEDLQLIRTILSECVSCDMLVDGIESPLSYAIRTNNEEVVDVICAYTEYFDKSSSADSLTPFMFAILNGFLGVADILKQIGANVKSIDSEGLNVIQIAFRTHNKIALRYLKERGFWDGAMDEGSLINEENKESQVGFKEGNPEADNCEEILVPVLRVISSFTLSKQAEFKLLAERRKKVADALIAEEKARQKLLEEKEAKEKVQREAKKTEEEAKQKLKEEKEIREKAQREKKALIAAEEEAQRIKDENESKEREERENEARIAAEKAKRIKDETEAIEREQEDHTIAAAEEAKRIKDQNEVKEREQRENRAKKDIENMEAELEDNFKNTIDNIEEKKSSCAIVTADEDLNKSSPKVSFVKANRETQKSNNNVQKGINRPIYIKKNFKNTKSKQTPNNVEEREGKIKGIKQINKESEVNVENNKSENLEEKVVMNKLDELLNKLYEDCGEEDKTYNRIAPVEKDKKIGKSNTKIMKSTQNKQNIINKSFHMDTKSGAKDKYSANQIKGEKIQGEKSLILKNDVVQENYIELGKSLEKVAEIGKILKENKNQEVNPEKISKEGKYIIPPKLKSLKGNPETSKFNTNIRGTINRIIETKRNLGGGKRENSGDKEIKLPALSRYKGKINIRRMTQLEMRPENERNTTKKNGTYASVKLSINKGPSSEIIKENEVINKENENSENRKDLENHEDIEKQAELYTKEGAKLPEIKLPRTIPNSPKGHYSRKTSPKGQYSRKTSPESYIEEWGPILERYKSIKFRKLNVSLPTTKPPDNYSANEYNTAILNYASKRMQKVQSGLNNDIQEIMNAEGAIQGRRKQQIGNLLRGVNSEFEGNKIGRKIYKGRRSPGGKTSPPQMRLIKSTIPPKGLNMSFDANNPEHNSHNSSSVSYTLNEKLNLLYLTKRKPIKFTNDNTKAYI